jgi:aspartyl protease family protein
MLRGTLIVAAILALIILALSLAFPERLRGLGDGGTLPALVQSIMVAILVGSGLFAARDQGSRPGKLVLYGAAWAGIMLFLVAAYSQRDSFSRLWQGIAGELSPAAGQQTGQNQVTLRRGADGHFHAETRVNGRPVRMLVDTGATDVALDPADARDLGIDVDKLVFNIPVSTAAGRSQAAFVRLDTVSIGDITIDNVDALVMSESAGTSLLGMGFLDRLSRVEVEKDMMLLSR